LRKKRSKLTLEESFDGIQQSLRGFEEEEAIREALKRFLASIISE